MAWNGGDIRPWRKPVGADPQLAGTCLCSSRWSVLCETTIRLSSDLSWLGPVTALSGACLQSSGGPVVTLTRDRRPGAHPWSPGSGQGCRTRQSSGNTARQRWRIWPMVSQFRPSKGIPTRMPASESQWPSTKSKATKGLRQPRRSRPSRSSPRGLETKLLGIGGGAGGGETTHSPGDGWCNASLPA